jgi:hypothetical protein
MCALRKGILNVAVLVLLSGLPVQRRRDLLLQGRTILRSVGRAPGLHLARPPHPVQSSRTPYNQYDSIVRPLTKWLKERGVRFELGTRVTDLDFRYGPGGGKGVERIHYLREGAPHDIAVRPDDLIFVTNGSMTAASSLGSMTVPPKLLGKDADGSWALWETLAEKHSDFGRPVFFNGKVDESKWLSFTVTMRDPIFFKLMEQFTGNVAGTGGSWPSHSVPMKSSRRRWATRSREERRPTIDDHTPSCGREKRSMPVAFPGLTSVWLILILTNNSRSALTVGTCARYADRHGRECTQVGQSHENCKADSCNAETQHAGCSAVAENRELHH